MQQYVFPHGRINTITVPTKSGYASHVAGSVKYIHRVDGHAVQLEKKKLNTILYCAANQWAQLFLVVKFLLFTINCYMFRFLYQIFRQFIPVALWMIRIALN